MCGRYAFYLPPGQLKEKLGLENLLNIPPRYNCAPTQELPIIIKNRAGFARWGFRPTWAQDDDKAMAAKMINARSETVSEKPAFAESWGKGRLCLVPANGFYEWHRDEKSGVNQPYYITPESSDILLFAGLWSKVENQISFTILTKQADENLAHLHHRSPVMIGEEDAVQWFTGRAALAQELIAKSNTQHLQYWPVNRVVGNIANDHEKLIEKVDAGAPDLFG